MRTLRAIASFSSISALVACSSGAPAPSPDPTAPRIEAPGSPGDQYTGDDLGPKPKVCDATKPMECLQNCSKAECYPTSNIGTKARASVSGNRMPNFRFWGRVNLDPSTKTASSGDLAPIQLSDFYDPMGTKFRVLRLVVAARWCGPCNQEADYIVQNQIPEALAAQGGFFLQLLLDGLSGGDPATKADLDTWISATPSYGHSLNFSAALDGDSKMEAFWQSNGIPENIMIDARSMEILSHEAGFGMNIQSDVQKWIDWTKSNPPQAL